ncbi:MAG: MXAN_5187 C-terminal domain-containing protein [Anaeromyxobacteraceae bacterium]
MAPPTSKPPGKGASALQDPRALEEAQRQDRHRSEELADTCGSVEEDLEALKARFEMYFLGIERREPAREREEIKRRVAKLKGEFTRNTGLRFRIQTLHARYLSYERMWMRSAREKEEGTYRRDLLRARRHAAWQEEKRRRDEDAAALAKGAAPAAPAVAAPSAPAPAAIPAAAPPVAPAPAPAAVPRSAEIPEAQLRALFAAYVDAKRRCNEDVSRLTYEALARTVAKQVPELLAKHKATRVEFRVVVKDGRAVLKAVPRM